MDMASHYMHMYATLSRGGASQSHKKVDATRSWVLYQYYHSKVSLPESYTDQTMAVDHQYTDCAFHLLCP